MRSCFRKSRDQLWRPTNHEKPGDRQKRDSRSQPKGASPADRHLGLGLPASRTLRLCFLLRKPIRLWGAVTTAQETNAAAPLITRKLPAEDPRLPSVSTHTLICIHTYMHTHAYKPSDRHTREQCCLRKDMYEICPSPWKRSQMVKWKGGALGGSETPSLAVNLDKSLPCRLLESVTW